MPRDASDAAASELVMLDLIFIVAGIVFFVVTAAYADACDRL